MSTNLRRQPEQGRSRERVDGILAAARDLLAEEGSSRFTMSALAKRAGVTLASIYRYFPDKTAIVRALAERSALFSTATTVEALERRSAGSSLREVAVAGYRAYFASVRNDPVERYLTAAVLADPALEHLDLEITRSAAKVMAPLLEAQVQKGDPFQVEDLALLLTHLSGAAARLVNMVGEEEGRRVEEAFIAVVLRSMR
jgi:AcrR family transcriptional regulator